VVVVTVPKAGVLPKWWAVGGSLGRQRSIRRRSPTHGETPASSPPRGLAGQLPAVSCSPSTPCHTRRHPRPRPDTCTSPTPGRTAAALPRWRSRQNRPRQRQRLARDHRGAPRPSRRLWAAGVLSRRAGSNRIHLDGRPDRQWVVGCSTKAVSPGAQGYQETGRRALVVSYESFALSGQPARPAPDLPASGGDQLGQPMPASLTCFQPRLAQHGQPRQPGAVDMLIALRTRRCTCTCGCRRAAAAVATAVQARPLQPGHRLRHLSPTTRWTPWNPNA
jgi:hypothetical protein